MADVKSKIAALLAMTREAGCSEAEALAAAKKAAALMLEYGLSAADVYIDDQTVASRTKGRGARDHLWPVVADCTNTACMVLAHRHGADVQFIGRAPGPDIAVYLFTIMNRAVDRAIAEFKRSREYRRRRSDATRRQIVYDFTLGMVMRLAKRLVEIYRPLMSKQALAEANQALTKRHGETTAVEQTFRQTRYDDAASAGWAAGGRVGLSQGVGGVAGRMGLEDLR